MREWLLHTLTSVPPDRRSAYGLGRQAPTDGCRPRINHKVPVLKSST